MADVCVIGAGVAGLTAAYRLLQGGHHVTVLEAKPHAGGLSQTARRGGVITELDDDGTPFHQTARLDEGLYVNLGPGRLPHHHRRILGLCAELGVALEPYLMTSDANYWVDARTGRRLRRRRLRHDERGRIAELAYTGAVTPAQKMMIEAFGDLGEDGIYRGSRRAGEELPLGLVALAGLRHWTTHYSQPEQLPWQATLFQPAGGMDAIWRAILPHLGERVIFNAPVAGIRTSASGVTVRWRASGDVQSARFDWCLTSVPLPLLAADVQLRGFSRSFRDAVAVPSFAPACKVGWQAERRWWESDDEQIYGGISYTNHVIQQFWYPSVGFGDQKATLTGAYSAYGAAEILGDAGVGERLAIARRGGELIHPEVADPDLVPTSAATTVAWHRVPYQAGGWCHWDPRDPAHADAFARLQDPDGRVLVIGDQVSAWPGWQEGCVTTAQRGVDLVAGRRVRAVEQVPDSAQLTVGDHPDVRNYVI